MSDHRVESFRFVRPCVGEWVSGDAAFVRECDGFVFAAIVDVLGHGAEAHELARSIEAELPRRADRDVVAVLEALHESLAGSRGAAVGACAIEPASGQLAYAGIGNTVLRRFGLRETRLVSRDGVLGQTRRSPRREDLALQPGDLVLLYTDGVSDRFGQHDYPGLIHHDVSTVARTVVERFGKSHDDAACIAIRYQ